MNTDGLADLFTRQARRFGRYEAGGPEANTCVSCVRKRFSFPGTCNDGWDRWRKRAQGGDPGGCVNWIGWDEMAGPKPEGGGE